MKNISSPKSQKHPSETLQLFFYGTLKSGCENHMDFCNGAFSIEPAIVRGLLYLLPIGFPILAIPPANILAAGTADPKRDLKTQLAWMKSDKLCESKRNRFSRSFENWRSIRGELMTFSDPELRLPAIDQLEGFHPGRRSLYTRVLTPVRKAEGIYTAAWTYVLAVRLRKLKPVNGDSWDCP